MPSRSDQGRLTSGLATLTFVTLALVAYAHGDLHRSRHSLALVTLTLLAKALLTLAGPTLVLEILCDLNACDSCPCPYDPGPCATPVLVTSWPLRF